MDRPSIATWSDAVEQAEWIATRLAPFDSHEVTSVVPGGYEAYARVLHPAEDPARGDPSLVRWAEVAAWSGMPLRRDSQFHSLALPPESPRTEAPWTGQGPDRGNLYQPDAEALADILRNWTRTPERCWFCVWDGYGWDRARQLTPVGQPSQQLPDPIPAAVRRGPRVHLPCRDYLLYTGPVEAALAGAELFDEEQSPNLWWPEDQLWCVATEIDLAWTYVGGPSGLIENLITDGRIEVLPAEAHDPLTKVEDWVQQWADEAAAELCSSGHASIVTSRGKIVATLERRGWLGRRILRTESVGDNGVRGSGTDPLGARDKQALVQEVGHDLVHELIGLVGG
jgi:hypothetical protein